MLARPLMATSARSKSVSGRGRDRPGQAPGSARALGLLCAVLTAGVPATAARAATGTAPAQTEEQDVACEATPSLDEAKLITARDLHARGEEAFDDGDYLGAVDAWTQVLVLMPEKQADLRVQLAHAHRRAYAVDDDQNHLHSAHALFTEQLESSSADDAARDDLEAEIADVEATLGEIEDARARARAEREDAIRQEQIRRDQRALAEAEARHQRNIQKIYYGAGGSLAGLGVGSLAAMTALLARGARTDREGRDLASTTNVPEGRYQELLQEGEGLNRAAMAIGIVGGVLVLAGTSLLVVAAIRHKRVIGPLGKERVAVVPTLGGARLRF